MEYSYAVTLAVGLAYFAASSMMLLANKLVVTFIPAPVTVTTVQYVTSVVFVVLGAKCCGFLEADTALRWDVLRAYISIPFLFSLAIFSNMKVLEGANVETFMVFRFSTPVLVALVDFALMGKTLPSLRTWFSFLLIVSGAVCYTLTDEGFKVTTYFWIVIYLVAITTEMIVVKHIFSVIKMTNWTRVYLNNLLSLLFQPFFFFASSEYIKVPRLEDPGTGGYTSLFLSSILGIALAWSGTALRVRISATSFTVVGVVCKVVTELANVLMWEKHANESGLLALSICFIGSIIFVPSPPRSPESTWSNNVWLAIDKTLCGALTRFELESPEFVKALNEADARAAEEPKANVKYQPVNTVDLAEDDIEMKETSKRTGAS